MISEEPIVLSEEDQGNPLLLTSDGKLIYTDWVYDDIKQEGKFISTYIEFTPYKTYLSVLDKPIRLHTGVTLESLIKLVASHKLTPDIYNYIFNNCYIPNFIKQYEDHHSDAIPYSSEGPDGISHLEIYRLFEYDTVEDTMSSLLPHADFHGIAVRNELNYCVSWIDPVSLYTTPLKLNTKVDIYEENHQIHMALIKANQPHLPIYSFRCDYTLGEVIRAVFWESSWGGGPTAHLGVKSKNI